MKKFITTDNHPELKKGIEISETGANIQKHEMFRSIEGHWKASDYIIKNCLEKGYIKEVEEKEFTRSELKNLAHGIFGGARNTVHERIDQYLEYHTGK